MPIQEQIQIRLQLTTRSSPPVWPIDIYTNEAPTFWRGESVAFNLGIFDPAGVGMDLSNLAFLEVDIAPMPTPNRRPSTNQSYAQYTYNPYPTTPPAPLLSVTIPKADIVPIITRSNFERGIDQNGIAVFDWIATQSLNLNGQEFRDFLLYVHGLTDNGNRITFGGSQLRVWESGVEGVYLPNTITPLDVPFGTILHVLPNQQMLFSETISVEGTILVDGELVQF